MYKSSFGSLIDIQDSFLFDFVDQLVSPNDSFTTWFKILLLSASRSAIKCHNIKVHLHVMLQIAIVEIGDWLKRRKYNNMKFSLKQLSHSERSKFWYYVTRLSCHVNAQCATSIFVDNITDWNGWQNFDKIWCDTTIESSYTLRSYNMLEYSTHCVRTVFLYDGFGFDHCNFKWKPQNSWISKNKLQNGNKK